MVAGPSELYVEVTEAAGVVLRLLFDVRDLGVPRAFLQLLEPFVDDALFAFDDRFDIAVADVFDRAFEAEAARHARGEKAVSDALNLAVDLDDAQFLRHVRAIVFNYRRRLWRV